MKTKIVDVGAWGDSSSPNSWTYLPRGTISQISITHNDIICSLIFTSKDSSGNLRPSNRFGTAAARSRTTEIYIDVGNEKLNGISGTVGTKNGRVVITSLAFTTDRSKSFGVFGTAIGTPFSLPVKDGFISGFHGNYGECLEAIGVYIQGKPNVSFGPWGSLTSANLWTYQPKGIISHISVTHEDAIYSLIFTSKDSNGNLNRSIKLGNATGSKRDEVSIDHAKKEKINGITGTVARKNGWEVITSISFFTNKNRSFGPFGIPRGIPFSLMGEDITGFHGSWGEWIHAIGVYVQDKPIVTLGPWGSLYSANYWIYLPKGAISHISITHDDAIYSLIFTSTDANGNLDRSIKFGNATGSRKDEIDIDVKNEKITGINGTVGTKNGWVVITSLTFSTDNYKSYGPFGTATGTTFSLPVENGFISGFHGSWGEWIQAIGIYASP